MNKRIVFMRPGASTVSVGTCVGRKPGESDDEFIARTAPRMVPSGVPYKVIPDSDLPLADRDFRDAWVLEGEVVKVNMSSAREIHRDRLREQRVSKLAALDIEYMLADEAGDTAAKQQIAAQKQILRDITADPRIDAATAPAELREVTLP